MIRRSSHVAKAFLRPTLAFIIALGLSLGNVWAPEVGTQNVSALYLHNPDLTIKVGASSYLFADFLTSSMNQSKTVHNIPSATIQTWFTPAVSGAITSGDWNFTIYYKCASDCVIVFSVTDTDINGINFLTLFQTSASLPASNGQAPATVDLGSVPRPMAFTANRLRIVLGTTTNPVSIYLDSPLTPTRLNMPFLTLDAVYPPSGQISTTVPSLTVYTLAAALITVAVLAALVIIRRPPRQL